MRNSVLRIGTRASKLAQWQAHWVAAELKKLGQSVEIVDITTSGDEKQSGPIADIGQQGVFTKEIQAAVLENRVDLAVHSLKDLPTETVDGLVLAAVSEREDVADALVTNLADSLAQLPPRSRIGTGSLRRQAQLKLLRPDCEVLGIRGNVDTRLRKLDDGEYDAIMLAAAGLKRLRLEERITEYLGPPHILPAVGQGALGIECREQDADVLEILRQLEDRDTRLATDAERAMLAKLHGGCSVPVGAWGRVEGDHLQLDGLVASVDGQTVLRASGTAEPSKAVTLGQQIAEELLAQGAAEVITNTCG